MGTFEAGSNQQRREQVTTENDFHELGASLLEHTVSVKNLRIALQDDKIEAQAKEIERLKSELFESKRAHNELIINISTGLSFVKHNQE